MVQIAKCGNDCAQCTLHVDNLTDTTRRWCAQGMARYINWHPDAEGLRECAGCQSTEGFLYIRNCAVRLCARYNGVDNCAYCAAFPCPDVPRVSLPADHRSTLEERLGEPVPEEDYAAFVEPYEGMRHLSAIRIPLEAQDLVEPTPVVPLLTQVVDFPDSVALSGEDLVPLLALHELLSRILTGRVDLYVRHIRLQQRRREILDLLWLFGRHGQPSRDESQLVIDSRARGALGRAKRFSRGPTVVRKGDHALHRPFALASELLLDLGVAVDTVPLAKRTWYLRMALEDKAGGLPALEALVRYTQRLVERYGEPKYLGRSRYRGEAYERFAMADMSDLAEDATEVSDDGQG